MFDKNKKNCKKNMKSMKKPCLKVFKALFCVEKGQSETTL